jgi:hypothetical protein
MKVILNKCYGGFDVSDAAYHRYAEKKGIEIFTYSLTSGLDYEKTDRKSGFVHYLTKDFGDFVKQEDVNDEDILYLNAEMREDPVLVEVVEELGKGASGAYGELKVVEIPDGMKYVIDEYDGYEELHEDVPTW